MIWNFNYDSPIAIKALLEADGLVMSKKFGQNFMIDVHARSRLAGLVEPAPGLKVWEIGPGIGALTHHLLEAGAAVTAFEIDHGFCRVLREKAFVDEENFTLVEGDFLKTWEAQFARTGAPDVLFSNLPYNVGSVCIARILEEGCFPGKMVFTLQSEVARRLAAMEGTRDWSSLSMLVQIDYLPQLCFSLSGSCFYPKPNVSSSVITLTRREESLLPVELRELFSSTSRKLFAQKRKTIKNNLSYIPRIAEILGDAGINPAERAENLTIAQVVSLLRAIQAHAVKK